MAENKNQTTVTVLTITVGFIVVFLITKASWAIYTAAIVGILSLVSGTLASYIEKVWMKIGWLLSLIVPKILLTAVYFIILTPIALLARLLSKRDHLSLHNPSGSLFKQKEKSFDKNSFENPW